MEELNVMFNDLFNNKIVSNSQEQQLILKNKEIRVKEYLSNKQETDVKYDIYENDIEKILKELPNNKSIGFADVSNEMYKYGSSPLLIKILKNFFEKMIRFGKIPLLFNVGIIRPIIKDEKKDPKDKNNYDLWF